MAAATGAGAASTLAARSRFIRTRLAALRSALPSVELVHVLGRLARRVGILVVVRAADVDRLGRQQQILALVDQGQRIAALRCCRAGAAARADGARSRPCCLGVAALDILAHRSRRPRVGRTSPQSGLGRKGR